MDDPQTFWRSELQRFLPDPPRALQEALEYVCCPICQVLTRLPVEYFCLLPGRWPEEPDLRAVVTAAGGFCNPHSWRLMSMQSNVAVAVVFADVLAGLAEHAPETETICPVCYLERMASDVLLRLFVGRLEDDAERERTGTLFGLCYPHWRAVLRMKLPAPVRQFILDAQIAATARLRQQVQGFLDKSTIELKWTRTRDESRAPRRALLKAAGNEGV